MLYSFRQLVECHEDTETKMCGKGGRCGEGERDAVREKCSEGGRGVVRERGMQ